MRAVESAKVIAVQKTHSPCGTKILIKTTKPGGVQLAREAGKQMLRLNVQWEVKGKGKTRGKTLGLKDGVKIVDAQQVTSSRCMYVCVCECVAVASLNTCTDTHALSGGAGLYASETSIDLRRQGSDEGQ